MKELLHLGVSIIAQIHNAIMRVNDACEANFTDKELHFLIIGLLGMAMIFVVYPLFKQLAQHGHEMVIAWIYVFTVIFVITFAIEIGQEATNTGNMDFGDIAYGIAGFLAMFMVFSVIRGIYHLILRLIAYLKNRYRQKAAADSMEE